MVLIDLQSRYSSQKAWHHEYTKLLGAYILGTGKEKGAAFASEDFAVSYAGAVLRAFDGSIFPIFATDKRRGRTSVFPNKKPNPVLYTGFDVGHATVYESAEPVFITLEKGGEIDIALTQTTAARRIVGAVGSTGLGVRVAREKLTIKVLASAGKTETAVFQTTDGQGKFTHHRIVVKTGE